jgi:hypothetical protein
VRILTLKRLLHLLLLLAFVAGLQLSVMPMTMAAPDGDGMTMGGMAGDCGGCDKHDADMPVSSCVAVCVALFAVIDPVPQTLRPLAWLPESWAVPLLAGLTISPDTSPPRT